jgi:hypothetical protein
MDIKNINNVKFNKWKNSYKKVKKFFNYKELKKFFSINKNEHEKQYDFCNTIEIGCYINLRCISQ